MDVRSEVDASQRARTFMPAASDALNFAGWLGLSLLASAALAWLAVVVQRTFAPFLIFPLLLGLAVGLVATALLRVCRPMNRSMNRTVILAGTLLCVVVAFAGQFVLAFLQYRSAYEQKLGSDPQARLAHTLMPGAGPANFRGFLTAQAQRGRSSFGWTVRGQAVWLIWAIECLAAIAGGLLATAKAPDRLVAVSPVGPEADPTERTSMLPVTSPSAGSRSHV